MSLKKKQIESNAIMYLPCDEIFDAKELSRVIRLFLDKQSNNSFLLVIDEITFVKDWGRVIKALADEGHFRKGLCLLTGSDTLILKEAAMSFPGRRGKAEQTDFHLYPLSFSEYTNLRYPKETLTPEVLYPLFQDYLICGGYLRAINDLAESGEVSAATFSTYEQWIRGDFLKQGKSEEYLLAVLLVLLTTGVSQISYSTLTQKIGLISKETCINYLNLLERMDVLFHLQAYDQNKKQGFPKKDRKFHFLDPFITRTIFYWLKREGYLESLQLESMLVEACVASHCYRLGKTYYFKGQGEIDVIWLRDNNCHAFEVKWSHHVRPADLKMLNHFENSLVLGQSSEAGIISGISKIPLYQFLYNLNGFPPSRPTP